MDADSMMVIGGLVLIGLVIVGYLVLRQSKAQGAQQSNQRPQSPPRSQQQTASGHTGSAGQSPRRTSSSVGQGGPWDSADAHKQGGNQPQMRTNWFLGKTGAVESLSFHIGERMASIGRGVSNYIQVGDETASERHVLLMGNPRGLMVTDLESSNGTFINGRKLEPNVEYELNDGDEVKIGDSIFLYRKQGRYTDDTQSHRKHVDTQEQTKAAMSIQDLAGGSGNIKQQVMTAVKAANGDYAKAAAQLDLDIDIIQRIVQRARNE